jgi:hypothetical protein
MNRNFANGGKIFAMQAAPVMVASVIQIGAAGAVSSASKSGNIISSVQHMSTGVYKINLREPAFAFIAAQGSMQSPSVGLSGVVAIEIQNAANASISSVSAPSLTIKCLDAAGALVDPANGSSINMMILLNNSSVPA